MKKIVKIDGKTYAVDTETKDVEEVEVEETPVEETPEVTPEVTPEEKPEEKPEEVVEEKPEDVEEKITKATNEVVSKLGLDKLTDAVKTLEKKVAGGDTSDKTKVKALLDLSDLMKKDVNELTTKEKIVGFFQAMIQNNEPALKALSEGTPADGGYLFPKLKFIGELKLGELLGRPLKRIISSQALPVMA